MEVWLDLGSGAILPLDVTAVVALLAKIGLRYSGVWVGRVIYYFFIFWKYKLENYQKSGDKLWFCPRFMSW